VLKQTHYLATCPHRGKKKFKYLKRALQSTNVLNGHVDYLKWILSQPCFQQPVLSPAHVTHTHHRIRTTAHAHIRLQADDGSRVELCEQDQALTNAINTCLQPYVTKGEEYIHGWHCIKVNVPAHHAWVHC
jgi:hypothetical protein